MKSQSAVLLSCSVLAGGLLAQSVSGQTVTVQNTQGMGVRHIYTVADGTTVDSQTYDKSYLRGLSNATGDNWGKVWLQFDLTDAWATYGQANLTSATLTIWSENGTSRRFSVAGLLDTAGLEGWDMNTLTWDGAPGNDTASGTAINFGLAYGGAPLWTVQNAATDAVVVDLGTSVTGITDGNYDQCASYTSLDTNTSIADFLKTDTDGKVTLIGYDHTNSSNQSWWTGIAGTYLDPLYNGELIRDSPTLTLTFAPVPEPASFSLVLLGAGGLLVIRRRS